MQAGGVRVRRDGGGVGVNATREPVQLAVDDQDPYGSDDPGHGPDHGRNGGEGFDHARYATMGRFLAATKVLAAELAAER